MPALKSSTQRRESWVSEVSSLSPLYPEACIDCSAVLSRSLYCFHRTEIGGWVFLGADSALWTFRSEDEGCTIESNALLNESLN
jgi:hypothetical protein